jgi:large subunit ribosomal protein L13
VNTLSYRTVSVSKEMANKEWVVIDAENQILGRFASQVAMILRGKHKPTYTPHSDCGDYVIIINAEKIRLTGKKFTDKEYFSYSGYPGGDRISTPAEKSKKDPTWIVENAIRGMLPKNRLGRAIFRNLKVIIGTEHQFAAQQPKEIKLNTLK